MSVKFLLVIPNFGQGAGYSFPLGIAYISGALKAAGYEVRCMNLNTEEEDDKTAITRVIKEFDPDVCGTGTLSPYYKAAKMVMDSAREAKPDIINIVGGGILTASPEKVLLGLGADIGVIGEGEHTIVKLAETLSKKGDLAKVDGIIFKTETGTEKTKPVETVKELGELAWPDFDGFDANKMLDNQITNDDIMFHMLDKPRSLPMSSSRSCPFPCTFCFHPTGQVYRQRPLDDFFAELDHLVETYNINMIEILDELFALKKGRMEEFCRRIKPYNIKWWASLHTTSVTPEVVELLKDAGCVVIGLGLESVSPLILESMRKKTTREKVEYALESAFGKGVAVRGNFIFGDPAETLETANDTLHWWANNQRYHISLVHLQVLPGSPVYLDSVKKGIIEDDPSLKWNQGTNVTKLSDSTYSHLHGRIALFEQTLLHPATVHSFEKNPELSARGEETYNIHWSCPHCDGENHYDEVLANAPMQFQALRLTCRCCGAYVDVENLARPQWRDEETEEYLAIAEKFEEKGNLRDAVINYEKAVAFKVPPNVFDRPLAAIQAASRLATIYRHAGEIEESLYYNSFVLLRRVFDPLAHLNFAISLLQEGTYSSAALYLDHAKMLAKRNNDPEIAKALAAADPLFNRFKNPNLQPKYIVEPRAA